MGVTEEVNEDSKMAYPKIKLWKIPFPEWNFKYAVWGGVIRNRHMIFMKL